MCENINENNLEEELDDNIVVLTDENGEEVKFEFLDLIELDEKQYVVLLPVEETDEAGEVVILQIEDTDDENAEEESYISVDDEETLNKVFSIFKDKFKDEFDFVD